MTARRRLPNARHLAHLALGLWLALALAAAAAATWNPPTTLEFGLGAAPAGISPALWSTPPVSTKPPAPGSANLAFKPAAAVSRRVEREVLDDLARRNRAAWGPRVEADLRLADLKGQFDLLLRLHGRSPTNLGDVLGAYVVLGWEAYAGDIASQAALATVTRHWRRELRRGELAMRTDAQKQALAEALAWRAMLAWATVRSARQQAAPQLFALRESVRREVLQATGIDFAAQRLTARGFEPRVVPPP